MGKLNGISKVDVLFFCAISYSVMNIFGAPYNNTNGSLTGSECQIHPPGWVWDAWAQPPSFDLLWASCLEMATFILHILTLCQGPIFGRCRKADSSDETGCSMQTSALPSILKNRPNKMQTWGWNPNGFFFEDGIYLKHKTFPSKSIPFIPSNKNLRKIPWFIPAENPNTSHSKIPWNPSEFRQSEARMNFPLISTLTSPLAITLDGWEWGPWGW